MSDVLEKICADTRALVERAKARVSFESMHREALRVLPPRGFLSALRAKSDSEGAGFIAEIKKASPSAGLIRPTFSPSRLAKEYAEGGAACLSVLTEPHYFQGSAVDLVEARMACKLPVLRKDFMLDVWQVAEARTMGADCILIIMAIVDDATATDLHKAAAGYGMDVLIEVHTEEELQRALKLPSRLIGINSRNLNTLKVDLDEAEKLISQVPLERFAVSESGISQKADVERMKRVGARGFLVGESLLKQHDAGSALIRLRA